MMKVWIPKSNLRGFQVFPEPQNKANFYETVVDDSFSASGKIFDPVTMTFVDDNEFKDQVENYKIIEQIKVLEEKQHRPMRAFFATSDPKEKDRICQIESDILALREQLK